MGDFGGCVKMTLCTLPVWHCAGNSTVVLLFMDDPQVMHVPGPHSKQHQKKDLRWIR